MTVKEPETPAAETDEAAAAPPAPSAPSSAAAARGADPVPDPDDVAQRNVAFREDALERAAAAENRWHDAAERAERRRPFWSEDFTTVSGMEVPHLVTRGPLMLMRFDTASLSGSDLADGWTHPARVAYRSAYKRWSSAAFGRGFT